MPVGRPRRLTRSRSLGYNVQTIVDAQAECPRSGGGSKEEQDDLEFGRLFILRTLPHIHLRHGWCQDVAGHRRIGFGRGGYRNGYGLTQKGSITQDSTSILSHHDCKWSGLVCRLHRFSGHVFYGYFCSCARVVDFRTQSRRLTTRHCLRASPRLSRRG